MMRSAVICSSFLGGVLLAQSPVTDADKSTPAAAGAATATHDPPNRFAGRAGMYCWAIWSIDSISAKQAEAGERIRFTYRVVDANKANLLADRGEQVNVLIGNSRANGLVDDSVSSSDQFPAPSRIGPKRSRRGVDER